MEERVRSELLRGCTPVILQETVFMTTKTKTTLAIHSPPDSDDGRGIPEDGKLPLPEIDGHQLVVDEEIRAAIPALSPTEREGLYNSLRVHGLFTPITLVEMPDGTKLVLDGYERLALWARCQQKIEEWKPALPLRADVLPLSDIVGRETDPAVCGALLIARAIAINTARRQMPAEKVKDLTRNQLMREYQAGLQRSSTWLAAELGVALSWLIEVRTEMWDGKEIPCPTNVLNKSGSYQANPAFKEKPSRPDTLIKARSLPPSGVFEEEPKPEVKGHERTEAVTEVVEDEPPASAESADLRVHEESAEEPDAQTQHVFPEIEADAARFQAEMAVVMDWDQRRDQPLGKHLCMRLWAADLLDVDLDSKRVVMLADRSQIEHIFVDMLSPVVRELGIPDPDRSVIAAIHSLLNPFPKKSPRRK
jgi:hypothetical protein